MRTNKERELRMRTNVTLCTAATKAHGMERYSLHENAETRVSAFPQFVNVFILLCSLSCLKFQKYIYDVRVPILLQ